MTYTELATQHEAEYNRPDKTAMTQQWIEDAYRDIMSRRRFEWLKVVSEGGVETGVWEYGLPTDFNNIINLVFQNGTTDSWAMNVYTQEEFDILHSHVDEDAAGRPEDATIVTSSDDNYLAFANLIVWPKPDAAYTFVMRYEVNPPALSGTLIPIVPTKYHQSIIFGSLMRGFAHVREYEAAMYWEKRYETMINRMIEDDKYAPSRIQMLKPFSGASASYPPDYWKKYNIRGIR